MSLLPRNVAVPALMVAVGWYGGTKYSAPDYLINSIDGVIADGGELIGGLFSGDKNESGEGEAE